MKVRELIRVFESIAPPSLAAEWDNIGLLIGRGDDTVRRLLLCIDLTRAVLSEAKELKAGMVLAYHPVIFKPLGRLTDQDAPIALEAARRKLAVYSMHTALDAAPGGTNDVLADALGLTDRRPLEPAEGLARAKIVVFGPAEDVQDVADAAFGAGAGRVGGYERCSFFSHGLGTFWGGPETSPTVGQAGRQEAVEELRLEITCPRSKVAQVVLAIEDAHSYETPAVDVYPLGATPTGAGMGRVGRLERPVTARTLLKRIREATGLRRLQVAWAPGTDASTKIHAAACSAGSAGSMWRAAADAGAQLYLTGEMRHHDALAASAAGLSVVCTAHSNSERPALPYLAARIAAQVDDLEIHVSAADADPFAVV